MQADGGGIDGVLEGDGELTPLTGLTVGSLFAHVL